MKPYSKICFEYILSAVRKAYAQICFSLPNCTTPDKTLILTVVKLTVLLLWKFLSTFWFQVKRNTDDCRLINKKVPAVICLTKREHLRLAVGLLHGVNTPEDNISLEVRCCLFFYSGWDLYNGLLMKKGSCTYNVSGPKYSQRYLQCLFQSLIFYTDGSILPELSFRKCQRVGMAKWPLIAFGISKLSA